MPLRFGTTFAICFSILTGAICSWAISQEQQNSTRLSPQPNQNQLRQQSNQPLVRSRQQDNSLIPSVPEMPIDDTQLYMRAKLANSQRVLEGLVTENFVLIANGAKQMKKISEAAHWPRTVDEVYQHYSVSFRNQCDKLAEQAIRQDLQAAHYTYLHMSTTCVDCHNYVRGRFRVERKKRGGPVQLIPTHWDGPDKKKLGTPQPDDDQDKTG